MALNQDSSGRRTGDFGGVQWDPPSTWRSKSYLQGKTIEGVNSPNYAKYNQWVPIGYGTGFVTPVIANWLGEGNSSRGEFIVCLGYIGNDSASPPFGGIQQVILNDVTIPFSGATYKAPDPLFRWNYINDGSKGGGSNLDALYSGQGDPYGSLAVIEVVVPQALAGSDALPSCQVICRFPALRVYSGTTTYTLQYSANPAWGILDILLKAGWTTSLIDIQSFIDAATVCDTLIPFTTIGGASSTHSQYSISLAVEQRRSAADLVRGIRNACKAMLVPNSASSNGLLQLVIKQTLGDQQHNMTDVDGTNTPSSTPSISANGTSKSGYSAYDFDESNILTTGNRDNKQYTLKITQRSIADSPNRTTATFQDEENQHVIDTYNAVDIVDVTRATQEVSAQLSQDGIPNYDQMRRVDETTKAETYRGNPRGDSGGTWIADFVTTVKAQGLKVGHIIRLSDQRMGLTLQPFRITKLKPSINLETYNIGAAWHDDNWYTWSYGQGANPYYSATNKQGLARPPFGWEPNKASLVPGDPIYDSTEKQFDVAQVYAVSADGSAIASVNVTGALPVNSLSTLSPPLVKLQGTTANTGGVIQGGGVLYVGIVSVDSGGKLSALPRTLCVIAIPPGTSTNTVTVPVVAWPQDGTGTALASGYQVFASFNPNKLTWQATGSGNPASITLNGPLKALSYGAPDAIFSIFEARAKRIVHGGVWGAEILTVGTHSIQIADPATGAGSWTTNQWTGRDVSVLANVVGDPTAVPPWNLHVTANTADTLTIDPSQGDLTTLPLLPGMVIVMRFKPDTFTANTIGDSAFTPSAEVGDQIRFIGGTNRYQTVTIASISGTTYTITPPFLTVPDSTSRYIVEIPGWDTVLPTIPLNNSDPAALYTLSVPVDNRIGQTYLVKVYTVDVDGYESFENDSPLREIYCWGANDTLSRRGITADSTQLLTDRLVLADTTAGPITYTLLPSVQTPGHEVIVAKETTDANTLTVKANGTETMSTILGLVNSISTGNTEALRVVSTG